MARLPRASTPDSTRSSRRWGRARPAPSLLSRAEIADALGGVAIAISLVPPLCVVGIALRQGQLDAAAGASLLFLTNFLAILFAGGVVFLVLGLGKSVVSQEQGRFRRRAFLLLVVGLVLVTIPLSLMAYQNVMSARENTNATAVVQQWVDRHVLSCGYGDHQRWRRGRHRRRDWSHESRAAVGKPTGCSAWSPGGRGLAHPSQPRGSSQALHKARQWPHSTSSA